MAQQVIPKEEVLDTCILLYRVHKNDIRDGDLLIGAFKPQPKGENGMSTWWRKYLRPDEVKKLSQRNPPSYYKIRILNVGKVRNVELNNRKVFEVEHTPENSFPIPHVAHVDIFGWQSFQGSRGDRNEVRSQLKALSDWVK
jgi:hypothetical protein